MIWCKQRQEYVPDAEKASEGDWVNMIIRKKSDRVTGHTIFGVGQWLPAKSKHFITRQSLSEWAKHHKGN